MKKESSFIIGNPLIYYSLALFLGAVSYVIFYEDYFIGVAFATSFFFIMAKTTGSKFFYLISIFFILGLFFNFAYFSFSLPYDCKNYLKVTVNEDTGYCKLCKYKGRYINILGIYDDIKEGEEVLVRGKFKRELNFSKGIIGSIKISSSKKVKNKNIINLYKIKNDLHKKFLSCLSEEDTSIVMALCFGEDKYISSDYREELTNLGVVHAISVSGFHMAIIFKILEFIPSIMVQISIAFLYVIFTGGKPSTIRAFIMILILKLGKKIYRNYNSLAALAFSSIILLSIYPYYCVNSGFILSYSAVLGIILFNKKLQRKFYKLPKLLNESISISLSSLSISCLYSIPLFNKLSLGAIVGNLLLVPMYSIIIILGNIGLIVNKFFILFKIDIYMLQGVLKFNNIVKNFLVKVILPPITLEYIHVLWFIVLYFTFYLIKKGYKRIKYIPLAFIVMVFFYGYNFIPKVAYINLGKEEGAIFKYKGKKVLLINNEEHLKKVKEEFSDKIILGKNTIVSIGKYKINENNNIPLKKLRQNLVIEIKKEDKAYIVSSVPDKYMKSLFRDKYIIEIRGKKLYNNYGKVFGKAYLIK
ncbi:ComEC/Rec2 family competence protein [Hathewaya limosa]|uniref:Competence protein ComEC n=1 Tax=Hathewaya limosa TaxID=1536 RepID=A0ABU0JP86_HATLI|nr:ComEC/Rec2 family competence protein [Hathewaya limosa]MDQ0478894.1 competence protein ComEC [Hathewaya limosa]